MTVSCVCVCIYACEDLGWMEGEGKLKFGTENDEEEEGNASIQTPSQSKIISAND